ncbi:hypothetical protein [Stutzerimonas stutzeri]|jgi:hypothetical protein|nr:hypothetical protein [Stutzerimonas stutzeri]
MTMFYGRGGRGYHPAAHGDSKGGYSGDFKGSEGHLQGGALNSQSTG